MLRRRRGVATSSPTKPPISSPSLALSLLAASLASLSQNSAAGRSNLKPAHSAQHPTYGTGALQILHKSSAPTGVYMAWIPSCCVIILLFSMHGQLCAYECSVLEYCACDDYYGTYFLLRSYTSCILMPSRYPRGGGDSAHKIRESVASANRLMPIRYIC